MFTRLLLNLRRLSKHERCFSNAIAEEKPIEGLKMQAWQVHNYGEDLILSSTRTPIIQGTNEVLVEVKAASLNPIDLLMKDGHATTLLSPLRRWEMELPLTLGRDFSGTIVGKGLGVSDQYQIGDEVYGFAPLHKQGSLADYVITESDFIRHRPEHLSHAESASIVYTAMTTWGAVFLIGGLQFQERKNKRILILGASGGVGTIAIQLFKSQGMHVTGTCSTNAIPLVTSLGADDVIDYTLSDANKQIAESRFDVILDCVRLGIDNVPKDWKFKQFISLDSPLMSNTTQYGLVAGLLKSGVTLMGNNLNYIRDCKMYKWGFIVPSERGLIFIDNLVKSKEIKPVIHKEFDFERLPEALNEVKQGHLRGKVVIKH